MQSLATSIAFILLMFVDLPLCVISKPALFELTPEQIRTFRRDGVLVVRGLLQGRELDDAIKAAKRVQRSTSFAQRILYHFFRSYRTFTFQTWRRHKALERVAFDSAAPTICAALMGLSSSRPVRLLKDAVLGYCAGDTGCGWHVDDKVFWPCEDRDIGKRDAGINVWITLSPVTAAEGGGLAVAPGTHKMRFSKEARKAIATKGLQTTCLLETLKPECHAKMESLEKVYDLKPGDAILHDRYIFHRTHSFVDPVEGRRAGVKHRISLRYVPSDSTFYNYAGKERATEKKHLATGDVLSKGGEYYPQVWPESLPEERGRNVIEDKNPFSLMLAFRAVLKASRKRSKE